MPHSQGTVSTKPIHPRQDGNFPEQGLFAAPGSHQNVLKPFDQGTEVTKETAAGAIGASRFTLNDFTYFSLSSQSSFHLSLTVLVRYRSPTNIVALEEYYLPLCAAVPSNTTLRMRTVTGVSRHGTRLLRSSEGCLNNHLRASATCRCAPLDHNSHGQGRGFSD